jgi:hypothetical protein
MSDELSNTQQIELEESRVEKQQEEREAHKWAFANQKLRQAKDHWGQKQVQDGAWDTVIEIANATHDNSTEIRTMKRNVVKTAEAVNKLADDHRTGMHNIQENLALINGKLPEQAASNPRPKDTLRIPTPLGKPVEIPGDRIRDATRLIAICAAIWLAWHVIQMRREQKQQVQQVQDLKAIAMPRMEALGERHETDNE